MRYSEIIKKKEISVVEQLILLGFSAIDKEAYKDSGVYKQTLVVREEGKSGKEQKVSSEIKGDIIELSLEKKGVIKGKHIKGELLIKDATKEELIKMLDILLGDKLDSEQDWLRW